MLFYIVLCLVFVLINFIVSINKAQVRARLTTIAIPIIIGKLLPVNPIPKLRIASIGILYSRKPNNPRLINIPITRTWILFSNANRHILRINKNVNTSI